MLSEAKRLTHEAWITLRNKNASSACVRSPTSFGMTQCSDIRATAATGGTALPLRGHQPAGKFFFEVACEIHTKLSARIQTQRVAICAIEQQLDRSPSG